MEIQELRYFLALSETLNFTRAAERCNVSQPALTRAIKSLEDKLGAGPLINRERNNTHLTEAGRIMLPYFEHVLRQMEAARSCARGFKTLENATLTVGLMCTIGPTHMVDLLAKFHRRFDALDLYLRDGPLAQLEEWLSKGEIDVAICCQPEGLDERFHALPLYDERFCVAMAADHRLARQNAVTIADLHNERYLSRANCEYADYLRGLRERLGGVELHKKYVSERDDWIQSMVLAGLGITYIPEFAVTIPGLVTRPLVDPVVTRTVQLVTVRGRPHSPSVGAFVQEVRRHPWQCYRHVEADTGQVAAFG